jgi:hypothetical protein
VTAVRREDADIRVVWAPGTASELAGTCRCGATFSSSDPKEMWNWYAEHEHTGPADREPERS